MEFKIALAGNPNVGKTTLYNLLTRSFEGVGNFHGVTVDIVSKTIEYKGNHFCICDLPGMYSLSTISKEEAVSRDRLLKRIDDVIINVCDANNLSRNLYLTLQLLEAGLNVVLAVNMVDELKKTHKHINFNALESELGISVVPVSAKLGLDVYKLLDITVKAISTPSSLKWLDGVPLASVKSLLNKKGDSVDTYTAVKILENDELVRARTKLKQSEIDSICGKMDYQSIICKCRFDYISQLLKRVQTQEIAKQKGAWIDKIVLNRFLAIPIFLLVMGLAFWLTFDLIGKPISEALSFLIIDVFGGWVRTSLKSAPLWLSALLTEAIIGGVGTVICFLPQIILLFFFLAMLEESGYLARAAFVLDGVLKKVGLNGKSVFTMLMGFGCTAAAVLTARTQSEATAQKKTVILTPFMSCGAKMPVYSAICAAYFVDGGALVIFFLYLLGVAVAVLWAAILQKTKLKCGESDFIMEVPPYRLPSPSRLVDIIYINTKLFLVRVSTIILAMTVLMWFASRFSFSFQMTQTDSIITKIAGFISPIFAPLGFDSWQAVAALLSGLVAKEAVISSIESFGQNTMAQMFLNSANPTAATLSFLTFILLYIPCIAALSAMKKEIGLKLTLLSAAIQMMSAYAVSLLIYFVASAYMIFGAKIANAVAVLSIILACIFIIKRFNNGNCKACKLNDCKACKKAKIAIKKQ